MLVNTIIVSVDCPRCGTTAETEVEAPLDGNGGPRRYGIGETVAWSPSITADYSGRPPLGDVTVEGYAVCPVCTKDYFVEIRVERDRITGVEVDLTRRGYIP